jgi:hypothetical protein
MRSREERRRGRLGFEPLEGRVALSGIGGIDDGPDHHRGRDATEVRNAADHNAGDDNLPRHSGLDERAGHDAGDDNLPRHSGKDDGSGHH